VAPLRYHSEEFMTLRRAAAAAVLAAAACAAHSQVVVVNEGFNDVTTLAGSGWVLNNASTPIGPVANWFQGDQTIFAAFAGAPQAYIAANFNNAAAGGTLANYVFTPVFTTQGGGTVSFWARSAAGSTPADEGFTDHIRVGRTTGGTTPGDFIQIGTDITLTTAWTQYTFSIAAQGVGATGRAAIEYFGVGDTSDYVGVDSVNVNVVPEPETWALVGLGLAALGVVKRRRKSA